MPSDILRIGMASLHGAALMFGLIVPIGPQNLYVFQAGATGSLSQGVAVACAAAACNALLIAAGMEGFSGTLVALPGLRPAITVFAIVLLGYLGWDRWRLAERSESDTRTTRLRRSNSHSIGFICTVSLINPYAILDIVAVGGGASTYSGLPRLGFALACAFVSLSWFLGLVVLGRCVAHLPLAARRIGRFSAVSLWVCALILAVSIGFRVP